jgi:hypothetical protein
MAWLETCRIDAGKQIQHLKEKGISTRQAIKKLAAESGIPENTINNWIYERSSSKRIDVFYFFLDTMRDDFIGDGFPENKVEGFFSDIKIIVLCGLLWLLMEDSHVRGWYRAAFEKYGRTAKITDMMRTGKVWCDCPNCDGRVRQRREPHESMNPVLYTKQGYVKINALFRRKETES